jgi:DNA-binding NarL/FixJ family response regulator
MNPERRTRIVLADDHPEALTQATRILAGQYDVVGTAADGAELLDTARRLDPDVIVLDIAMPRMDGFEAARRLKAAGCRSRLVFLTVWEDPDYRREAAALGAKGYVVKSRLASDLRPAVAAAVEGRSTV